MAKKVVATLKKSDAKNLAKVIKMVKSPKTGAYIFKEDMMSEERVKDFLNNK
jgi:hypothetical protein